VELEGMKERVIAHLARETGGSVEVAAVTPLAGGACQENVRVTARFAEGELKGGDRALVLRSDAAESLPGSLDRRAEMAVINAAVEAGVKTPRARWLATGLLRDGSFAYFLDWVDGEAIGRKVVAHPTLEGARATLVPALARELARIHTVTPTTKPDLFAQAPPRDPAKAATAALRAMAKDLEPRPGLELALAWLEDHAPAPGAVTLVHGDFRTGNFLVSPRGLEAVLDWEFAHWGAPEEDLAWLCVRDWRFGRLDRAAGGIGTRAELYSAYAESSARKVDPGVVRWWEIFGNARWAAGAALQGKRYAKTRDLELLALARRPAEMEFEALRLIEVAEAA
jgi:aminoglycoside phosphotransferase (APT) family kinase protein